MKEQQLHILPWKLIIDKLGNQCSAEEHCAFSQWLEEGKNKEIFAEISRLWEGVQHYCQGYEPDKEYYWKRLSEQLDLDETPVGKQTRLAKFRPKLRQCISIAACLLFLLGASFYAGQLYQENQTAVCEHTYTNVGGKSQLTLPDGTQVWLHAHSRLTYDTHYGETDRSVRLEGEAYFDVTPDKERPFTVHAGEMGVKVYGTKFNVEAFSKEDEISVSLLEGSVALNVGTEKQFLQPGETGVYCKDNQTLSVRQDDVAFAASWAQDKLVFTNQTIGEIARFLSKWYQVEVYVAPELAQQYAYTFTLHNEPLEEIIRLMTRIHPFTYWFDQHNNLYINPKK